MRILRVKLENLNSLRGRHEVEFAAGPLAGAGLFAITGPTGAGKSTLLDAITLALYGRAARYGSTPSPEDMMSRHCGECRAEVEFRVPTGTYRAEWQIHRARGRPTGKVQAAKRYVYNADGQALTQNVRETEALIEKLVGLDYDRFLRSALLAQGQFAQFLRARPDERAELLESLTGTSIYSELGALAHTETGRREEELKAKTAAIQQIQLLGEEQRQKLGQDIVAAEETFGRVKSELEQANVLLNKAANLAGSLEREKQALDAQLVLDTERTTAKADLERLARHRLAVPFHGDLARAEAAENAAKTADALLQQSKRDHLTAVRTTRRILTGFRRLVQEKIEAAQREIGGCREKHRKALDRKTNAENWLAQHQSDRILSDKLTNLASELTGLKGARRTLAREWTKLRNLAARLDPSGNERLPQSAEELTHAAAKTFVDGLSELIAAKQTQAEAASKKAEGELDSRSDHLAKAKLVAGFEQHRALLKKGEACPLCGATEHPYAEGAEPSFPFRDLEQRVADAKKTCQERANELGALRQLEVDLTESGVGLHAAVGEYLHTVERLHEELPAFELAVPVGGKEDDLRSELQKRANTYQEQSREVDEAERLRIGAKTDEDRLQLELQRVQDKQSLLASITVPDLPAEAGDVAQIEEPSPRWRSVESADEHWSNAKTDLAAKSATLQDRDNAQRRLGGDLSNLLATMNGKLAGSPFGGIDELKAARLDQAQAERIEKIETGLKGRGHQLDADLAGSRRSIEQWRGESAPEGEAVAGVKERQADLQGQHNQIIRDLTTWKNQFSQDDTNRKAVVSKKQELETDRQRLAVWLRLRSLIGSYDGRTFRRYAQGISLDILVYYANRHLFRLSDRYRLRRRAGEELDLEVEDLHQAGAVRPMASLSGGESFLASLALALGLSDIAGRNVRIESLFIDEGFGSLDSDTLDVAISALETLRQDNKTVGVISHVDLLKERIAAQIIVEKQSGGTSTLRVV